MKEEKIVKASFYLDYALVDNLEKTVHFNSFQFNFKFNFKLLLSIIFTFQPSV